MQKKITILSCVTACICVFVLVFNICLKTRDADSLPFLQDKGVKRGYSKEDMIAKLGEPLKAEDDPIGAAIEYDHYSLILAGNPAEVIVELNTEGGGVMGVRINWQLDSTDETALICEAIEQELRTRTYAAIQKTETTTPEEHTIQYDSDSQRWRAKIILYDGTNNVMFTFFEIPNWMARE
mgnify:CR=1 FL=1